MTTGLQTFRRRKWIGAIPWQLSVGFRRRSGCSNLTEADKRSQSPVSHGRTCSFEKDRPFIAFVLCGPSISRAHDAISNARFLKVPTMAVLEDGVEPIPEVDYTITIPSMPSEYAAAILAALPMQLFSHQFSLVRGIDPDTIRMDQPVFKYAHKQWIFPPGTH